MIFSFSFTQPARLAMIGVALAVTQAIAQGQTATAPPAVSAPSLRQALDAAWALSPQARAADNRRAELQARQNAANGWFAGEAVATLAHRTDRLNANGGLREYEAEVELPLWSPRVRSATQRQIAADTSGFEPQQTLARLKLAGQLRELAASLATARAEQTVAQRKVTEANALLQDVQRRVKAGDTARVDALQAQAAVQAATASVAAADSTLARQQAQWRGLTGLSAVATLEGEAAPANAATADHPALQATQAQVQAAQARLALTQADQRDPIALGIGITRERGAFEDAGQTSLRLALKIPLGGDNRNLPRLAAARAELDTAQAEADAAARQVGADVAAAQADLAAARAAQTVAAERVRLTREVQSLVAKSYQLGQADLPTRLRADNDSFDADLSEARARTDVQRAISQLNQAIGLFP